MIPTKVLQDPEFTKDFSAGPERVAVAYQEGNDGDVVLTVGQIAMPLDGSSDPLGNPSLYLFPLDANRDLENEAVLLTINTRFVVSITNRIPLTEDAKQSV